MNKILFALLSILLFASCASSYNIEGTSNISTLDGRKLYLKVLHDNDFKKLDSCDVIHGKFSFEGALDSVIMANIFMEDESVLPLVLESGRILVKLDNTEQVVSGTPLNDKLFKFFNKYNQIKNQERELVHKHDQAIMNGSNMEAVVARLNAEAMRLSHQEDQLLTSFVCDNFDNVLGPGVFFMVTIGHKFPELTPWIEDIMSKATVKFKNDSYVRDYYQKAQENQQIMNGMKDVAMPAAPVGDVMPTKANAAPVIPSPTPNELAKPTQ